MSATIEGRIAIFIPTLGGGGAERVMVAIANGLAARGYAVDLVLVRAEGPFLAAVGDQVRIVELGGRRTSGRLLRLAKYLRDAKPAAMVSALNHANVVAILARIVANSHTRLVISVHVNISRARAAAKSIRDRLMPTLMRLTYGRADEIVAASQGLADDIHRALGIDRDRIRVVYNPIQVDDHDDEQVETHPWLHDSVPVILSMGRLTAQKDFATLLRAFALLRWDRDARLIVLGEGELRAELEELAIALEVDGDVDFPGFIATPFAWLRQASVFAVSSAWEGFCNVLVEAMACNVPVVSTACPDGPAEILENGRWGRLVPVGDAQALAAAIAETLDADVHPDLAARASAFNLDRALDCYLEAVRPVIVRRAEP